MLIFATGKMLGGCGYNRVIQALLLLEVELLRAFPITGAILVCAARTHRVDGCD